MTDINLNKLPKFSELPVKQGAPAESSWGVFGDDDELGTLNMLTTQGVIDAAKLVRKGRGFRIDTPLGYANPPLFGRKPMKHTVISWREHGFLAFDDQLDVYNTQEGAQWDGYGHVGHLGAERFYNGVKEDEIKSGPDGRLGIHLWADKVIGRGVLADAFKYRADQGRPVNPGEPETYTVEDIQGALDAQGTKLAPGSILLVRTGWLQHYLASSPEAKAAMAPVTGLRACGIEASSATVEYLWDHRVAALGTDCPAVEQWPWDPKDLGALHYRTLALLGMPIGEQFDFEKLAADCADDDVYEFMFVSAPLNLVGGIASPPNGLAIK
ncbi:MAG: hypothetical protein GEU28_06580 [Dehalococcoidia bacterium]|nr:hypothetical protein [Dehalococcoidia bacterium]